MNDEIKIMHELNILSNTILDDTTYKPTISRRKLLLDYIINLQQENERLKERVAYLERSNNRREDTIIGLRFEVAEQEDYKSRCEKAIEYMQDFIFEPLLVQEDRKLIMFNENLRNFENILQNGSENDEKSND